MNTNSNTKDFYIKEGLSESYIIHRENISSHIMITCHPSARVLTCFPDGNSGIALMFDNNLAENDNIILSFSSQPEPFIDEKNRGMVFGIKANKHKITITNIHMDSIRFIRSLKYPGGVEDVMKQRGEFLRLTGLPEEGILHPTFQSIVENGKKILKFRRTTLDERNNFSCNISVDPEEIDIKTEGGRLSFISLKGKEIEFRITAGTDYTPMTPCMPDEILNREAGNFRKRIMINNPEQYETFKKNLNALSFLSYNEKFLAGSWRFLTYFGRDTMMSLMLLKECLNTRIYESGIQSVLDRLSHEGMVAHEEDIGCWATDHHIGKYLRQRKEERESGVEISSLRKVGTGGFSHLPEWGDLLSSPVYDYKMVDDDFMLPLMVDFFTNDGSIKERQKREFLEKTNDRGETSITSLLRNFDYIIGKTEKYGETGDPLHLIRINDGIDVGDWRDSGWGLGRGRYPGSINVSLAFNCLESIKRILESGIFSVNRLVKISRENDLKNLTVIMKDSGSLIKRISSWKHAGRHFAVKLSVEEMRIRITDYLLNAGIENEEREVLLSTEISDKITVHDFLKGGQIPEIPVNGLTFRALSLDEHLQPVEVMNSDPGFLLFFGEPKPDDMEEILKIITLPYPLGLALPGGIAVANPAYSCNHALWKTLDGNAYHGRVVWAWQMFLIEMGLCRQIKRFGRNDLHRNLVEKTYKCLKRLRNMEQTAGNLANSELWTHEVLNGELKPVAYGVKLESETESNPVQLWSTVRMAVMMEIENIKHRSRDDI